MRLPTPSPSVKLSRRQRVEQDIERCRNAKVVRANRPNPVLMSILAAEIIADNMRRIEVETRK